MATSAHFAALTAKHRELEDRIEAEAHRPRPDSVLLAMLKKQKLRLKEALSHGS